MPKAILAIRSYPITLLLAALIFAVTLVLTTTSAGKIRGGDDEGSGFGGTGRSGEFGGSGLGGTGAPYPFLTQEEERDLRVREELDRMREELRPVDIPDALQRSFDNNPLFEQTELANSREPEIAPDRVDVNRLLQDPAAPTLQLAQPGRQMPVFVVPVVRLPEVAIPPATLPEPRRAAEIADNATGVTVEDNVERGAVAQETTPAAVAVSDAFSDISPNVSEEMETPAQKGFADLVEFLTAGSEPATATEPNSATHSDSGIDQSAPSRELADTDDRRNLPQRFQRPALPPFQQMRPAVIDRVSISPPRPMPMRI